MKNIYKKGSLSRRKNTFEKKTGIYRVAPGHPSSRLTRRVDRFSPGQLQAWVFNKTNTTKAPGHPGPGLTHLAGRGRVR